MMGFCEYEKHTGTGLAVLIRSLLWRRRKNEKKRYSLTFSSVETEAKRHSPHQGLPAGGRMQTNNRSAPSIISMF